MATSELLRELRAGDHAKRPTVLDGVPHDERCLAAADEIERLRAALERVRSALDDVLAKR